MAKKSSQELQDEIAHTELQIASLGGRRRHLEATFHQQEIEPTLKKLIGKCFKYRNSYSSDSKWWLYSKIVGYKRPDLILHTFQIIPTEGIEFETKKIAYKGNSHLFETSISLAEFNKAYRRTSQKLKHFGELLEKTS